MARPSLASPLGASISGFPGISGATKGLTFGVLAWVVMGFLFFQLLGLGPFASQLGLGIWPALFSLALLLSYSVVMGIVYAALNRQCGGFDVPISIAASHL
jgi:hypothetical protein